MRKLIYIAIIVITILATYLLINYNIDNNLKAVDSNDQTLVKIQIPSGSSTNDIALLLETNKLIKNSTVFKYYTKKIKADSQLKAGTYKLSKSMSVDIIINELINGGSSGNTMDITIIEGLTIQEVAKSISKDTGLDYDKLLSLMNDKEKFKDDYQFIKDNKNIISLQGYLLPETYNIYKNSNEEDVIRVLLKQFDSFYISYIKPLLKDSKLNFEEAITLASIVEREAVLDEERDEVAAVFINRLNIDMKLQSCATVSYALGVWKERLTYDDIAVNSPYNTYVVNGLPPTPINSPGKASIIASLKPAKVDYLFFVSKGNGSHYFSMTYDEHIKAADEYLH